MIVGPETSLPENDDDYSPSSTSHRCFWWRETNPQPYVRRRPHEESELFAFSDSNYSMPREVREILEEEGLDSSTVETWLGFREIYHKRAEALRQFEMAKAVKPYIKRNRTIPLPPIKVDQNADSNMVNGVCKQVLNNQTNSPGSPGVQASPSLPKTLPEICQVKDKPRSEKDDTMMRPITKAEEMKWKSEQQLERQMVPDTNYTAPRIVLISSKVPWCHAMKKAIRKDGHILYVIYDFDLWTFQDIISHCRSLLDSHRKGCKAQSVLIICKGGPGYVYLLRNYVMTPQKFGKARYKCVRQFWSSMGDLLSKLEPQNAYIHIIGAELDYNEQGEKLKRAIINQICPNQVKVETPSENTPAGRERIELYFDFRKFLLWRSKRISDYDLTDSQDIVRSWSSIEEDAQRKQCLDVMPEGHTMGKEI